MVGRLGESTIKELLIHHRIQSFHPAFTVAPDCANVAQGLRVVEIEEGGVWCPATHRLSVGKNAFFAECIRFA